MFKYYLILLLRIISRIFLVFPIKFNRILVFSYSGKNYTCSPKYISEYLEKNRPGKYEIIWAFNDITAFKQLTKKYKLVKYGSIAFVYYHITSHFIITNTGTFKPVAGRLNQIVINTWHGGGAYKKTGKDTPYKNKWQKLYATKLGQKDITLFLTSSRAFTEYCIRGAFGYKGEVLECGLPRNDVLLNGSVSELKRKVCEKYHLPYDIKIALFAPTWRNYSLEGYESLDKEMLLEKLINKFGGKWVLLVRNHHFIKHEENNSTEAGKVIDVSDYDDMQELLVASSILISDYSSCIWDFSMLNRPYFLFVPDLKKYLSTFSLYSPINQWGGIICECNEELALNIEHLEEQLVKDNIAKNHAAYGNVETGMACKMVTQIIEEQSL